MVLFSIDHISHVIAINNNALLIGWLNLPNIRQDLILLIRGDTDGPDNRLRNRGLALGWPTFFLIFEIIKEKQKR